MAERFASHHADRSEAKGRGPIRPDRLAGDYPTVPYGRYERGDETPG